MCVRATTTTSTTTKIKKRKYIKLIKYNIELNEKKFKTIFHLFCSIFEREKERETENNNNKKKYNSFS